MYGVTYKLESVIAMNLQQIQSNANVSKQVTHIVSLTMAAVLLPKTKPPGWIVEPVVFVFSVKGVYVVLVEESVFIAKLLVF